MTWYALRTTPGAQRPSRFNPSTTSVEEELRRRGFSFWMPAEKRLIRDKLRAYVWKTRRFALMVGYMFIEDPHDWYQLSETPGVSGIVGCNGKPLPVTITDILMVRTMEADAEVEFDRQLRNRASTIRKKARHNPHYRKLARQFGEQLDGVGTISVPVEEMAA